MSAPDWVADLLHLWAAKDWSDAQGELGFPPVSPMFSRAVGSPAESEDSIGYSSAELRVTMEAVDWLQVAHPDLWRALSRRFRPWTRRTLALMEDDQQRSEQAMRLVAEYIDKMLG